ncbi:MAG: ATP-binding cassette domain-containing protein [Lachnospiraceae bacterium]|nr:ATP-binding cassette domain-containing protein [Lachnospiraceae bacterium]MDY5741964.1 ATP-binding cassette domain-containing protein [Lachnospiraceae bacterium]
MQKVLETVALSKAFGRQTAVDQVSMTIMEGDIYGFIGRNGAGKTTLIRMVAGLAKETSGQIRLFGSEDLKAGRDKIGTIIENPGLFPNMTGMQNVQAQALAVGAKMTKEEMEELLQLVGLDPRLRKKAKNYSLGMKQRLAIAIALIGKPSLLVLDEPTNGLDPEGIRDIRNLIIRLNREMKITVLISSHILGELHKLATRYGIIDQGKMLQEFTAEELDARTRDAFEILLQEEDLMIGRQVIENSGLRYGIESDKQRCLLFASEGDALAVVEKLIESGIIPRAYHMIHADLEDYFMKSIGGK